METFVRQNSQFRINCTWSIIEVSVRGWLLWWLAGRVWGYLWAARRIESEKNRPAEYVGVSVSD